MRKRRVYRGVSPDMDYSSGDQFWSTSKEVAENYAFQTQSPGRIDTSLTTDLPQNLYRATNKDELRDELGMKAEPYSFEFDTEVKAALQAQGYEGVRYNAGTDLGGDQAMELHIFGKTKPSDRKRGQAMPDVDYRGEHSAPDRQSGAPLHKVTDNGIYPADVYSAEGARLYGTGEDAMDRAAFNMISSLQDKPNASVRVYRAVPRNEAPSELVYKYQRQKDQILRTGKIPKEAEGQWKNSSEYYDWLDKEMARLKEMPDAPKERLGIESGDWVTPIRKYAEDHGKSALRNQYKVVSKLVKAKDVFTAGDSWLEWGYDPAK
jgi:hypothetical protein